MAPLTRQIVLLGLMGSGKTAVGRVLSGRLGWRMSDSDSEVLSATGRTAVQHVAEQGVDHLHALERDHLLSCLTREEPLVVCAAASVIDEPECRRALAEPAVSRVWLRASVETLIERFTSGGHRPRYNPDLSTMFRAQLRSRADHFAAVSTIHVDVDGRSVEDIASEILATVRCTAA